MAMPRPIPDEAPVTKMFFPESEKGLNESGIYLDEIRLNKSSTVTHSFISFPVIVLPYFVLTNAITPIAVSELHSSKSWKAVVAVISDASVSSNCSVKYSINF